MELRDKGVIRDPYFGSKGHGSSPLLRGRKYSLEYSLAHGRSRDTCAYGRPRDTCVDGRSRDTCADGRLRDMCIRKVKRHM